MNPGYKLLIALQNSMHNVLDFFRFMLGFPNLYSINHRRNFSE